MHNEENSDLVNEREHEAGEAERNKLNPDRAFYLATLGGTQALYIDDVLGNFDVEQPASNARMLELGGGDPGWPKTLSKTGQRQCRRLQPPETRARPAGVNAAGYRRNSSI